LVLAAILALTAFACGSEDSNGGTDAAGGSSDQQVEVTATDFQFDTDEVELEPGATVEVTLVNDGGADHTFTSDDLDVEVEAKGGETATTTFDVPDEDGTFEFHCHFHPDQMKGTITVGAGGDQPADDEDHVGDEKEDETKGGYDY